MALRAMYKTLRATGCSLAELDLLRELLSSAFQRSLYASDAFISRNYVDVMLVGLRRTQLIGQAN